jgi:glycosyltransferase involved in cell wall biosynthesis
MLEAIERSPAWTLDVVGPVACGDRAWLDQRLAASPDLAQRTRWHGRLTPQDSARVAAGAWVGMCLLEPTRAFLDSLPSKLYEYLAMGIVPVVTDLPRQRELVEACGSGYVADTGEQVAVVLDRLAADLALRDAAARSARQWLGSRPPQGAAYDQLAAAVQEVLGG